MSGDESVWDAPAPVPVLTWASDFSPEDCTLPARHPPACLRIEGIDDRHKQFPAGSGPYRFDASLGLSGLRICFTFSPVRDKVSWRAARTNVRGPVGGRSYIMEIQTIYPSWGRSPMGGVGGRATETGARNWSWAAGGVTVCLRGILALSVVLAGCGKPARQALRVGVNAWPGYEFVYLAQEKGFFREAGVDVRLVEFGSLSDSRRAFETDKLDGFATTIVEVLMARDAAPRDLRIVRVVDFSDGADVVIAGRDVHSVRDLRGKRVGVELASLGIFVLARALELEGLSLGDVTPVANDQRTMREQLLAGDLEATVAYPPESAMTLKDARFRVVFSSRQVPGEVVDVLAFDGEVLRLRAREVAAFLKAMDRAYEFFRQKPDEACSVMAEREGISPAEFKKQLMDGIKLVSPGEQASYFQSGGKLRPAVEAVARSLRGVKLISDRSQVTDCLQLP